jgi:hypothetical protein
LFKEKIKKGPNGRLIKDRPGKAFTLHHAYEELENDEKWKSRDFLEVPKKKASVGDDNIVDDGYEASSSEDGKRSSTPNSIARFKRLEVRKMAKEKAKKKLGVDVIKDSLDAMMKHRKDMNEERKMMRVNEMEELKWLRRALADERSSVADERRAAAEEVLAATESRNVSLEEKKLDIEEQKLAMEEKKKLAGENEQKFMFHGHGKNE